MADALQARIAAFDLRVIGWMNRYGRFFLRLALGVVFIWFGALKVVGQSPATDLVREVTWWIPFPDFVAILGVWEIAIGICFLIDPLIRLAIPLLFLHMPGTALPFLLSPERVWNTFPFALTTEGQYIVKNLVVIAAALVIGGTIRYRQSGFARFAPREFPALLHHGRWGTAADGTRFTEQGQAVDEIYFVRRGQAEVVVNGERIAVRGPRSFIGELSFLTGEPASATVRALGRVAYIAWPHDALQRLIDRQPGVAQALHASLSHDLAAKLREQRAREGEATAERG